MKICKEFVLREIAGEAVLVPVGDAAKEFNGLINLNDVAAFMWKNLEKVSGLDEMTELVLKEFDVDEELAKKDVEGFCGELVQTGFIQY